MDLPIFLIIVFVVTGFVIYKIFNRNTAWKSHTNNFLAKWRVILVQKVGFYNIALGETTG